MNYRESLIKSKEHYPFDFWLEAFNDGIGIYSEENCKKMQSVFDRLIDSLIDEGESADLSIKLGFFEEAVRALNTVRKLDPELIETMEREDYCDLFDEIALACGINPKEYGDGYGIASEWRTW